MNWLQSWQQEVDQQDITPEEKARCLLPLSTLEGWFITCKFLLHGRL